MMSDYSEIADPPRQCVIETVTACALKCPVCYIGSGMVSRPKRLMDWDLFSRICDQIEPFVKHTYCHLWGDPCNHPRIGEMVLRLKQFATVDLSTHGQLVTEENADALCQADTLAVSMEGIDQQSYEMYRVGGSWLKAMNALKLLSEKRKSMGLRVGWTYVVTRDTEPFVEEARKMAEAMGNVNFGAKSPYFVSEESRMRYEPLDEKYRRYDRNGIVKADRFACREFWTTLYLNPEGIAGTCCYDYDFRWPVGDFKENTILDIWNGSVMREMRRKHLARELNPLCQLQCGLPA